MNAELTTYSAKSAGLLKTPPVPISDSLKYIPISWFKDISLNQQNQHLADSLSLAATQALTTTPPLQRKPHLFPITWAKILHLQILSPSNIQVTPYKKAITKSAKKDRAIDIANRFLSDSKGSAKDTWQTIRSINKNVLP